MFDAISRVMYHASPDMILEYMHKEAPNLGIELHDIARSGNMMMLSFSKIESLFRCSEGNGQLNPMTK